jgi:cell division protein FtsQ
MKKRRSTREERIAARIAVLEVLLRDPTIEMLSPEPVYPSGDPDPDPTVALRRIDRPTDAAATGMDPRIRARRIAVRRSRGRRRLRVLAAAGGVAAAGVVAFGMTRTPLLDVDRIAVVGAVRTVPDDVLAAASIPSGQALLDVDLVAVERRVDDLPWVAAVDASRHWPGTVVIRVDERQPVAVVATDAREWAVLSGDGRLLETVAEPPAGLVPVLDVAPLAADDPVLDPATLSALEVIRLLPGALAARTAGVAPLDNGQVELRLHPRGVVRFGPSEELVDKIIAAESVLASQPPPCVGILDVRAPASPVLTPAPECG